MSRCKEFYDKWEKEPNWCEKCPSAVSQINSYLELVTNLEQKGINKEFTNVNLPEGAARPLFRERNSVVREKAIESVKKCLESGKNLSGQFSKKLTAGDVKKVINKIRMEEMPPQNSQLPDGLFEVIVIDPPWQYGTEYDPDSRRVASPYPEMSLGDIANIKIPAADNCILWLWTTHKFMRYSFGLLDKWGFQDKVVLTWVKNRIGIGSWLRSQTEFCIMAVKGNPKVILTNQSTVLNAPIREHSRKPDEFYKMVDSLCVGRKLDYFSREKREGWAQYGNDTARF